MYVGVIYDQKLIDQLNKERFELLPFFELVGYFYNNFAGNHEDYKLIMRL